MEPIIKTLKDAAIPTYVLATNSVGATFEANLEAYDATGEAALCNMMPTQWAASLRMLRVDCIGRRVLRVASLTRRREFTDTESTRKRKRRRSYVYICRSEFYRKGAELLAKSLAAESCSFSCWTSEGVSAIDVQ